MLSNHVLSAVEGPGIEKHLLSWIPGRASYVSLVGMLIELSSETGGTPSQYPV
jgi:hypothetical protein